MERRHGDEADEDDGADEDYEGGPAIGYDEDKGVFFSVPPEIPTVEYEGSVSSVSSLDPLYELARKKLREEYYSHWPDFGDPVYVDEGDEDGEPNWRDPDELPDVGDWVEVRLGPSYTKIGTVEFSSSGMGRASRLVVMFERQLAGWERIKEWRPVDEDQS